MTKRLGLIGRADQGGIAAQTRAVAEHMRPAAVLLLDMEERGRGPFDPSPWARLFGGDKVRIARFPFTDQDLFWLLDNSDVIFAVEGPPPGRDDLPHWCVDRDIPFVIHANPELWRESYRGATTKIVLPTVWHHDRFPDADLLPMPVDRKRFPFRLREHARTFLHVAAPAFHDRNGTDIVRAALPHVNEQVRFYVIGVTETREETRVGNVELIFLPPVADHADVYPPDADVLVVPRRYGGQALCFNEAASLGMPILTLSLHPQTEWDHTVKIPVLSIPSTVHMIGGDELVYDADPRELAATIDWLARNPLEVAVLSKRADAWAAEHSWGTLKPVWTKALGL